MKKNRSESGEKPPTGQFLSRFFDTIVGDLAHILRTRAISALNALETACGGVHHGALSACSRLKLRSRRDQNLIDDLA